MSFNKPIRRIAIVGTGVIGASWATYYLSRGFDVVATDPAPNAEANLRKYVDNAWPALARAGLAAGASRERLMFTTNMSRALAEADLRSGKRARTTEHAEQKRHRRAHFLPRSGGRPVRPRPALHSLRRAAL
jgi:glycine/D-amino acid oxidase-like deaminating enzyme